MAHALPDDTGRRMAAALVLAPAAVLAILVGWPLWDALLLVGALLAGREWAQMAAPAAGWRFAALTALATVPGVLGLPIWAQGAIVLGAGLAVAALWRRPALGVGLLAIVLPVLCLIALRRPEHGGAVPLLWLCVVIWLSDSAAWWTGRQFGGPRLAPVWSPAKTWSGLAGGLAAGGLVGMLASFALSGPGGPLTGFAAGVLVSAAGAAGDLFESACKRRFGVKDSGRLIPGHGGVLDRVDALLAGAVVKLALAHAGWCWT